ncbi:MAG: YybS family protein [Proteobacteria bacterium]|nr:YybS family protein [Pseudomonadota bacterium]MBU1711024.1 YybS family protein [Pseudomonadota bacterium]
MDRGRQIRIQNIAGIVVTTLIIAAPALSGQFTWLHSLAPLPVFYYLTVLGKQQGGPIIITSMIIAGAISLLFGSLQILLFTFTFLPVGYIMYKALAQNEKPVIAGMKALLVLLIFWVLFGLVLAIVLQKNIYQEFILALDQNIEASYKLYAESAEIPETTREEIKFAFEQLKIILPKIFPGLLLISICSTVWLNLLLGNLLINKKNPQLSSWGNYREWSLPDSLVWVAIFTAAGLLLPFASLNIIAMNTALLLSALYFFQGLAVLANYLSKWSIPLGFKILIYLLILIQIYGIILLAIIGIIDVWSDFRKIRMNNTKNIS